MRKGTYKIIPEQIADILKYIEIGTPIEIAIEATGVNKTTFWKDIRMGEKIIESGRTDLTEDEKMIIQLVHDYKKAKARAVIRNVTIINQAGKENWTASAWWLERRYPSDFGRREHIQLEGNLDIANMDVKLTEEEQEEYKKRREGFFQNNLTIDDIDL